MTRVHWLFVAALVAAFSYGLLPTTQPQAQLADISVAALVATPVPIPTVQPTTRPTSAPTHTPLPTRLPAPTEPPTVPADAPLAATPSIVVTAAKPAEFSTHPEEPRFIYIDQYVQRLYVYEYGQLVREIPCSTGLPESDKYTPAATGRVGEYWPTFTSFGVEADDAWFLFKSSGNILIHSLPYTRDEQGNKIYQDREALGVRPSSHGCVRIAPEDAAWLTAYNPQGALFEVTEPFLDHWLALN